MLSISSNLVSYFKNTLRNSGNIHGFQPWHITHLPLRVWVIKENCVYSYIFPSNSYWAHYYCILLFQISHFLAYTLLFFYTIFFCNNRLLVYILFLKLSICKEYMLTFWDPLPLLWHNWESSSHWRQKRPEGTPEQSAPLSVSYKTQMLLVV